MKILLFKKTTDSDLFKGLQICYKDINGVYNKLGVITDVIDQMYPIQYLINTSMGAYHADELKLIDYEEADSFDELKQAVINKKSFVPVTEKLFYYSLEVLPPVYLKNGCFQMGECHSGDLYYTFGEKDGKYYGCLCNSNFAINNF